MPEEHPSFAVPLHVEIKTVTGAQKGKAAENESPSATVGMHSAVGR